MEQSRCWSHLFTGECLETFIPNNNQCFRLSPKPLSLPGIALVLFDSVIYHFSNTYTFSDIKVLSSRYRVKHGILPPTSEIMVQSVT